MHAPNHDTGSPVTVTDDSDIAYGAIVRWAIALIVVIVASEASMYLTEKLFINTRDAENGQVRYPMADLPDTRLPPAPRLQNYGDPEGDLKELRDSEDVKLTGYQWVDRNNQLVRIPITRAMELTVQRGLPTAPEGLGK